MTYKERILKVLTSFPMDGKTIADETGIPLHTVYLMMTKDNIRPNYKYRFMLEAWLQKKEKEIE
jgi:hypothetical protein